MKFLFTALLIPLCYIVFAQNQQEMAKDPVDGCPIFEMPDGDTVYVMKQYFMVFYKSGPNRSQSEEEKAEIQKGHLAHIGQLAENGYLSIAGPFGDDTELRGILIFQVPTQEKVEELMQEDPAVKLGRLVYEIHPWWGAKGSKLK